MVNGFRLKMTVQMDDPKKASTQDEEAIVHIVARQMLVARIFTASYIGRYFVEKLNDYRDVVQICEEENELIKDFLIVKQRVEDFYKGIVWSSITKPTESYGKKWGHCIWTKLNNVPFGFYWFSIEDVTFCKNGEMVIKIKAIKKFELQSKSKQNKEVSNAESTVCYDEIKNNLFKFFQNTVTWHNFKESAKFIFLLCMTIVTSLLYALQYLGDYSLKFFKEFNNFIKVSTPIFLHFIDFISKVVGGFYILIAMLWNGRGQQPPPPLRLQAPQQQFLPIKPQAYRRTRFERF